MLTPVDIQQKKFKMGIGYDKKDVNSFFIEVSKSYEELYRSNADLKEKVITLTDGLQHYKITEESLQKSLLLAEKNSQESKTNAVREAKNIELEAKNRANEIVSQAYTQLEELEAKMKEIESRYAEYKNNFALLVKQQFELLDLNDFDPDAYIDPDYIAGGFAAASSSGYDDSESTLGGYSDDPQMRDSSSGLGGAGGGASANSRREANRSNTTSVYGTTLGGTGIDPFGDSKASTPSQTLKLKAEKNGKAAVKPKTESKLKSETVKSKPASETKKPEEQPHKIKEEQEEDSLIGDIQEKRATGKIMIDDNTNTNPNDDSDGFEFV